MRNEILFNQYLKKQKYLITNEDEKSDVIRRFQCILYAFPTGAVYQKDSPFPVFRRECFVESFRNIQCI